MMIVSQGDVTFPIAFRTPLGVGAHVANLALHVLALRIRATVPEIELRIGGQSVCLTKMWPYVA